MINPEQIRAARALLDWSTSELAKQAGLTVNGINKIERGHVNAHRETLEKLQDVMESAGIEFLQNSGLRKKDRTVQTYDGVSAFEDFHEFLYQHLMEYGGEVCLSIYDESLLAKYRKDPEVHRSRMRALVGDEKVSFRILATKSSWNTRGYIQYKWLRNQRPLPTGFYAFGDCLALLSFVDPNSPYVAVLQSRPMTEAYRQGFNIAWASAENPPKKVSDE